MTSGSNPLSGIRCVRKVVRFSVSVKSDPPMKCRCRLRQSSSETPAEACLMSREEITELWISRIADYRASGEITAIWCERHQMTTKQRTIGWPNLRRLTISQRRPTDRAGLPCRWGRLRLPRYRQFWSETATSPSRCGLVSNVRQHAPRCPPSTPIYSVIETPKENGLNAFSYLTWLFV